MTPNPDAPQPRPAGATATGPSSAAAPGEDLLRTAATQLREEPLENWTDISESIQRRLKSVVRRSRPIQAVTDTGREMFVADGVLVAYLRQAVDAIDDCELDRVGLIGENDTCTGASVSVVSRYGHDYVALAQQVREVAYEVFRSLLGPTDPPFGIEGVDVTVTDLIEDDL